MDFDEMKGAYLRATKDDIVTRLRQEWEYGNSAKGCDYEMFAEAADEIERLRAENRELRSEVQRMTPQIGY